MELTSKDNGFLCQRCGWCCSKLGINISFSDVERWIDGRRWDILRRVNFVRFREEKETGFYFGDTSYYDHPPCLFLSKEGGAPSCSIYETRPLSCKDFPVANDNVGQCPARFERNERERQRRKKEQYVDFKKAYFDRKRLFLLLAVVYEFETELDAEIVSWEKTTRRFAIPERFKDRVLVSGDSPLYNEGRNKLEEIVQWQS